MPPERTNPPLHQDPGQASTGPRGIVARDDPLAPRVSIVLPTWNGEADLRRLLPRLAAQRVAGGFELLAVDSSSQDASRDLLRAAGADLEVIPQSQFRHGPTRSARASKARGAFLVFISQDAEPAADDFLERLLEPFGDERVAGAYARVLPRPDDDPLTRRTALAQPESADVPRVHDLDSVAGLWELDGPQRVEALRFNDVASAIRADVFRELPFPDLEFGEDFAWAARALSAGWRIAFAPRAVVLHAHAYGPRQAFERYRVDAAFHRDVHGHALRPGLLSALRGLAFEVREDLRFLLRERPAGGLRHALRSPVLRGAQVWGQFVGSRPRSPRSV